ncbi:MAG TPA: hypothetical protein VNA69_17720 [Thermoanaerobaculia bacterium]|nr:hypothetical protein [Thermoanaerobaculia bacterium]
MKRSFAVALVLPLLMSCASYKDRVPVRTEIFPAVHLASLQGQEVSLSVFEYHRNETDLTRILFDDLERELTRAGVIVVASAPLQLRVQIDYLTADFRQGRWESCGQLTGTLVRNEQNVVVQSIVSSYCTNETVNPWQVRRHESLARQRGGLEWADVLRVGARISGEVGEGDENVAHQSPLPACGERVRVRGCQGEGLSG